MPNRLVAVGYFFMSGKVRILVGRTDRIRENDSTRRTRWHRAALTEHYGLTDEVLDSIINYDIKYRMGR